MFYVYLYRDPSGLPMYIGKGLRARSYDHLKKSRRGNVPFHDALSLLESANLEPTIEIIKSDLTEDQAFKLEREMILKIGRRCNESGPLYNVAKGGNGGAGPRPLEVKSKISSKLKGVAKSEMTLKKMRGRTLSHEHCDKLKKKLSGAGNGFAKSWVLRTPSGDEVKVEALYRFCKENDLAYSSIVQSEKQSNPIKVGKSAGWKLIKRLGPVRLS